MSDLEGIRQIGEIINSHGNKGELKVIPLTTDEEIFQKSENLTLIVDNQRQDVEVISARPVKNFWIIQISGINDIDSAKNIKNAGIFVNEDQLKPLADDEFYIDHLLNAKVYSTENEYLGTITNYFDAGPQGVCEVTDGDKILLFPTTQEVLKTIVPAEKVVVNLIPGLRELNRK